MTERIEFPLEIEFLTTEEVCEAAHITRQTARRWGKIPRLCFPPALQLGPGAVRYRLSDLREWVTWLRAKADAKAAGQDHEAVPLPSYVKRDETKTENSGAAIGSPA